MAKRLSWSVRLERAEARGKFTPYDRGLAGGWNTCAIGERHNFSDETQKEILAVTPHSPEIHLGYSFATAVVDNDIPKAKRIYAEIQALP